MGAETRRSDDSELPGVLSLSGLGERADDDNRALVRVGGFLISDGGDSSENAFRCMGRSNFLGPSGRSRFCSGGDPLAKLSAAEFRRLPAHLLHVAGLGSFSP